MLSEMATHPVWRSSREIKNDLERHLADGGTLNDSRTGELYREWHGMNAKGETDLEAVELWAVSVVISGEIRRKTDEK